jgi:hypothetical protein
LKDWKAGEADAASNAVKKTLPTSVLAEAAKKSLPVEEK